MLNTSAKQLQQTIQDLSEIIVIRNRKDAERQLVNLPNTFEEVKSVYLNTLHDIPYTLHTNFEIQEVFLNKSYLSSIFINLLSNAIKYRSEARGLTIAVDVIEDNEGCCKITFSDNGIGIDLSRVKNRLFGMYQKFHDNNDGRGLGLFMVQSQVIAMGGQITVESELDKGTAFIITLPIRK